MRIEFKESMENPIWIGKNTVFFHKGPFLPIEGMENSEQVRRYLTQQFKMIRDETGYYCVYRTIEDSNVIDLYYTVYSDVDFSREIYLIVDFIKTFIAKKQVYLRQVYLQKVNLLN